MEWMPLFDGHLEEVTMCTGPGGQDHVGSVIHDEDGFAFDDFGWIRLRSFTDEMDSSSLIFD
jgi:hypothetical protein